MQAFKIILQNKAKEDLGGIVDYLCTLSPQASLALYDSFVDKIGSLAQMPERCPCARDQQLRSRGYRFLIIESYVVFFVFENETVHVRRILYNKRNFSGLL